VCGFSCMNSAYLPSQSRSHVAISRFTKNISPAATETVEISKVASRRSATVPIHDVTMMYDDLWYPKSGYASDITPIAPLMAHGVDAMTWRVWHAVPSTPRVFLQYERRRRLSVELIRPFTSIYITAIWIQKRHPKLEVMRVRKFSKLLPDRSTAGSASKPSSATTCQHRNFD
jgi:hypothetical protein